MSDDQWLRERLAAAVPEAPTEPGRAGAARERHRRAVRRTAAIVTSAAVVLIAAVVTPLAVSGGGGGTDRGVAPATSQTTGSCPRKALTRADLSGAGALPPGATWVRLCQGGGAPGLQAPVDALTGYAAQTLAAEVDGQPRQPDHPLCPQNIGMGYTLVFGYPDGTARPVIGEWNYGCGDLYVGHGARSGGRTLLKDFVTALRTQRASQPAPSVPPGSPTCGQALGDPFPADAKDTAQAVLCAQYSTVTTHGGKETVTGSGPPSALPIPAADLRTLLDDWTSRRGGARQPLPTQNCPGALPWATESHELSWQIDGVTAWGDATEIQSGPFGEWMDHSGNRSWLLGCPSAASEQILDRLLAKVPKP